MAWYLHGERGGEEGVPLPSYSQVSKAEHSCGMLQPGEQGRTYLRYAIAKMSHLIARTASSRCTGGYKSRSADRSRAQSSRALHKEGGGEGMMWGKGGKGAKGGASAPCALKTIKRAPMPAHLRNSPPPLSPSHTPHTHCTWRAAWTDP